MGEYASGDLVKLKSGGPIMTVEYKTVTNQYLCQWFVGTELKKGQFSPAALVPAPQDGDDR